MLYYYSFEILIAHLGYAELASKDAEVAVAKPKHGFSNPDSALGWSSVLSDTTAGVSQASS